MEKIKLAIKLLITNLLIVLGLVAAAPALAVSIVSIQTLPSYITTNSFKLSCTTDGTNAQFYYSKNGGAFTAFGPLVNVTTNPGGCVVQVDSSVVNDQTSYAFKVNVDGADSGTTTTFYDISGPSPVSNYYKERINDGQYKLHFHTPGDSDFDKVVIYRGDTAGFSADSGHEIARVSGGANSDMSYDDSFAPNAGKTYYYAIRALDHAGNSSSLVGDAGTTQASASPAGVLGASTTSSGKVTRLPKEEGQVLSKETTSPSPSASEAPSAGGAETQGQGGLINWVLTHKKISILAALALVGLGYYLSRKKSS